MDNNFDIIDNSGRAALVGLVTKSGAEETEKSLDELERLLQTAGGSAVLRLTQARETPDVRTVLGSGKLSELAHLCSVNELGLVVFDLELSPSQIRNIEGVVGDGVRIIDRSMLILDIFALHAVTGEGKLQVELAQLKYTAPRLAGHGTEMSRLGGGIGTRGPGESKLESDRRHLKRRVALLEEKIAEMVKNRAGMRVLRDKSSIVKVAIVGYTNAGKSTLLNRLTDAGILAEDKLFATLDPTTRKYELPCGETILLTDTVGFINKLPHHLVKAFKSTLEEACFADILIILTDASDPEGDRQLEVTERTLADLGATGKPVIYVFNKCDRGVAFTRKIGGGSVAPESVLYISALTGQGIEQLVSTLEALVLTGKKRVVFNIPVSEAGALNSLYKIAVVENVDYGDEFIAVTALADAKARGMMKKYLGEAETRSENEDE